MECLAKILVLCTLVFEVLSITQPDLDAWWGPEEGKSAVDTSIRPFKIKYDEQMISDLRARLKNHRPFTPPLDGAAFTYGFNTNSLDAWVSYWADSYNFTDREAHLNQFPHFKTNIQGLDMHFIWIKPDVCSEVEVVPLLMLHGWPGSIVEFYKAIPLITKVYEERGFAVEVIVPSLPGFGFSDATSRPHMGGTEMAVILRNLMHRIGHKKFYIQGGDWGGYICNNIATFFPDEVLGYHSNFALSISPPTMATWFMGSINSALQSLVVEPALANRLYPIKNVIFGTLSETGYMRIQATKPDTLGVALADSPSGLLAWILQTFSVGTRSTYKNREDGGLYENFTPVELVDNLMIYWMNNAFTTASRVYAETLNMRNLENGWFSLKTPVPTFIVQAKHEQWYQSPKMLEFMYTNLLNATALDDGAHFLAMELPELFSDSVLTALTVFRQWHKENHCRDEL